MVLMVVLLLETSTETSKIFFSLSRQSNDPHSKFSDTAILAPRQFACYENSEHVVRLMSSGIVSIVGAIFLA